MNNTTDRFNIDYFGCSDIGIVRIENQDFMGKYPKDNLDIYNETGQLFIVADGMGGHAGGRLASTTAVETMIDYFRRSYTDDPEVLINGAVTEANRIIYEKAQESDDYKKMGTTCVVLLIRGNYASIGHVGDSRIYLVDNNNIQQLTVDHTQVQEMLKRGILTPEEAEKHPSRSVLARALGVDPVVECDIKTGIPLKPGQMFVLCTDGLANVSEEEIKEITSVNNTKDSCDKLIELANQRGGKDNVTVQVIRVNSVVAEVVVEPEKKKSNYILYLLLIVLAAAVLLFGGEILNMIIDSGEKSGTPADTAGTELVKLQETDNNNVEIDKAESLLKRGRYDGALEIYKSILKDKPMHLAALNGMKRIITFYTDRADILRENGNYKDALIYYYKVEELQPGDKKIHDNIILCENQIKYNSVVKESPPEDDSIRNIPSP